MQIKNVAILTSGGDAPGMNKLIYSCCENLINNNIKPYVVINGFEGLYKNDIREANMWILENNANNSGSVIYCSRFNEHKNNDVLDIEVENIKKNKIDLLIVIGGNGSYEGAKKLCEKGVKVICLPATIDNDINFTQYTIGFDSALSAIVDTIDNLNFTAKTHGNVFLIEAMGRDCSDLTLAAALSSRVDYIVTKYNKLEMNQYIDVIKKIRNKRRSILFLISEKIYNDVNYLHKLEEYIEKATSINTKVHIIGFIQRGAKPTATERFNAVRFAKCCVDAIIDNKYNIAIGIDGDKFNETDLLSNNFIKQINQDHVLKYINIINKKTDL